MPQQELNDADVHALLEHVRGEAVPQRVRPEPIVEAARVARLVECGPCRGVGQVRDDATTGKQPRPAAMDLPDLSKHLQDGVCQRENPLLVPFGEQRNSRGEGKNRFDRDFSWNGAGFGFANVSSSTFKGFRRVQFVVPPFIELIMRILPRCRACCTHC